MKIAILNDTHFGVRNDSPLFLDYFFDFFENQFFPYIKENDIKTVLHLGDFMDRRKFVNFNTLSSVKNRFFDPLAKLDIDFHMLIGNHDTYYKNTNEINSPNELFSDFKFFTLYEKPTTVTFGDLKIGMIPWICDNNKIEVLDYLNTCSCDLICGHFELTGYEMSRGNEFMGGMSDKCLKRFETVLSGHFHNKSHNKNVKYLGTQYQITFADANETKGFHVLNTETKELDFIENKNKIFYVLNSEDISSSDEFSHLEHKYIKLIVSSETNKKDIDAIVSKIENSNPYDLNVLEDFTSNNLDTTCVDLSKDTITIINEEIDNLENDVNKDLLKKLTRELFLEALDL